MEFWKFWEINLLAKTLKNGFTKKFALSILIELGPENSFNEIQKVCKRIYVLKVIRMLFYTVYKHVYQNNYVYILRKQLYPFPFCVHFQHIGDTLAHVVSQPTWKHPRTLVESIGSFLRELREWTTKVLKEGGSVRSQVEPAGK